MLTAEQMKVLTLADKTGMIRVGDDKICPGIHFCPDWDSLPLCNDSPEVRESTCTCHPTSKA